MAGGYSLEIVSKVPFIAVLHLALAAAWMLTPCGNAQDLRYLSQQTWGTEEGLPQSSVHSVAQTPDGYLWIATEGGLARFDGTSFTIFDHTDESAFHSDDICCLADRGAAGLWIGTSDGVVRRTDGRFERYGEANGLPSTTVLSLRSDAGGDLLVETTGGWARLESNRFVSIAAPASEMMHGPDGASWEFTAQTVTATAHGATHVWRAGQELPRGRIATVSVDREGFAWIAMNVGLYVADSVTMAVKPVAALGGNSVLSVSEDAEGDHWVGTETTGLHVLRRLAFRSESGLAGVAVTSVAQAKDGSMWVGTRDDGVRRQQAGVWTEPVASNRLTSAVVLALAPAADGGVWVGTPDGLNYISGLGAVPSVQKITQADGLPDDSIRSLASDADGSLWVGTTHGLAHLRRVGGKITVENKTARDGLGGDLIGALFVPREGGAARSVAIWVSTSGGLSRVAMDGTVKTYSDKDGLGSPIVTSMAEDRSGALWAATADGGLSYFDGQRFHAAGGFAANGARENKIEGMIVDGKGALWLRMDRGVRRIASNWLYDCVTRSSCDGMSMRYGIADGLPNEELVFGASAVPWTAADGEVWFPTRGGVAVANAESVRSDAAAPPVVVQRLLIDDAAQALNGTQVSVPFGHSRITIEYVGLSFLAPAEVRYRYMLKGFDERWTEAGARRSATYTNLPPGMYEFAVQAANRDGVWSATGASVRFRVVPPVYRRWWFITLAGVLAVLLLVAVYLLRLRVLRREFNAVLAERNRMAREIHDTLTQDFVGTSLQLDIIGQQLKSGQTEQAIAQVKQTRRLVTDGLEEARRSIWELRANNSQDSLPTRMSRLVQRDTFAAIAPRLDVGGAYRTLEPRMEREILRITQEALSNVLRHAEATETVVELHYDRDALRLSVRDNGRGFVVDSAVAKQGHFGLLGMKERASSIDGSLEIASAPGEGSVVTLNVPLAGNVR